MENVVEKKKFTDKLVDAIEVISGPFSKLAAMPVMQSLQDAMMAIMTTTMLGSIALVIAACADGGIGAQPLKFLLPYTGQLYVLYTVCMGFIGLYACIAVGIAYGNRLGLRDIDSAIAAATCYIAISFDGFGEGFTQSRFGITSMLAGLVAVLCTTKLASLMVKKGITIKLPDMVPENIGSVFTSMLPGATGIVICWVIRTLLGFDFVTWFTTVMTPFFNNADTLWFQILYNGLTGAFWTIGLHFVAMTGGIMTPITTTWLIENQAAVQAGTALTQLPHIFTFGSWAGAARYCWPLVLLMCQSKVPGFKEIGRGIIPLYLFSISETVWFGVPVVMNPYLMISNILAWAGGPVIEYLFAKAHMINLEFVQMPWATPHLISGFVETSGDWRYLLLMAVEFVYGYCVHYPFFKAYEKATMEKINAEQNA